VSFFVPQESMETPHKPLNSLTLWFSEIVSAETGGWSLKTATLKTHRYSQTLNYSGQTAAEKHLHPRLWARLVEIFNGLNSKAMFVRRDFCLEMSDLLLMGIRVISHLRPDGHRVITVSFPQLLGTLSSVFAPSHRPATFDEAQTQLSSHVLETVIRPSLDLCYLSDEDLDETSVEQLRTHLRVLKQRHDEVDFYAALLTRYVANRAELGRCSARCAELPLPAASR